MARYHFESCCKNSEKLEFSSLMFSDFFQAYIKSNLLNLPAKNLFIKITREYFLNYYDFALFMMKYLQEIIENYSERSVFKTYFKIFCKVPNLNEIDFNKNFCNVAFL